MSMEIKRYSSETGQHQRCQKNGNGAHRFCGDRNMLNLKMKLTFVMKLLCIHKNGRFSSEFFCNAAPGCQSQAGSRHLANVCCLTSYSIYYNRHHMSIIILYSSHLFSFTGLLLKNFTPAESGEFLYQFCAPYHRYGQTRRYGQGSKKAASGKPPARPCFMVYFLLMNDYFLFSF